jgi:ribose/xylose/arabinose/galactoside ABC-type transport system permease subunit
VNEISDGNPSEIAVDKQLPAHRGGSRWLQLISRFGPLFGLILVWLFFAVYTGSRFVSWDNHKLMLLQTAVVGTAAVGATLVIISGGIDLSVGSLIACIVMIIAALLQAGLNPLTAAIAGTVLACLLGIATGSMIVGHVGRIAALALAAIPTTLLWRTPITPLGAVTAGVATFACVLWLNEKLIGKIELSPFIVTLGLWSVLRGAAKGIGNSQPIYPDQTWLSGLMQSSESGLFAVAAPGVWLMLVLAIFMAMVLRYTRFGRYVFAIGSNEQTARLCGIDIARTKILIYATSAACAGLAAILQFAYLNGVGDPVTATGYELKVIAAVVIGGASLSGGEGTITGTLIGAMLMTVIDTGCTKLGLDNWIQEIVTGGIIVAAASLDRVRHVRLS